MLLKLIPVDLSITETSVFDGSISELSSPRGSVSSPRGSVSSPPPPQTGGLPDSFFYRHICN